MEELGIGSEPVAESNNDFSSLVNKVYQPVRTIAYTNNIIETDPGHYYYDLNRNGQYDKISDILADSNSSQGAIIKYFDDGDRLTIPEIIKAVADGEPRTLFSFDAGVVATLGLHLSVGGDAASGWPKLSGDLFLEYPSPRIVYDQKGASRKEATPTTLQLNDIKLDLGSAVTDLIKPLVNKIDQYIAPIKPIVKFLSDDLKLPAKLGLAGMFESDGKPGTSLLEIADKLIGLASNAADSKAAPATAAGTTPTTTPTTSPAKPLTKTQKALRSLQSAIKFTKLIANLVEAVDTINQLTQDSNSLQLALGSWEKSFTQSNSSKPDPEKSLDKQSVKAPPISTTGTATTGAAKTGTVIPAPADASSKFKKALNAIQAVEGLKFPFLTDFTVPIRLLLGEKGVDLVTFEPPNLALNADFSVGTYIFPTPPLKVGLNGSVGVNANLLFGFDTSGAEQWKDSGFDPSEIYKLLDGFYLGDKHNGVDTPELTVTGTISPYASLDALIASFTIEGGITATAGLDLVDEGEDQGTSDGKVHISEIIAKIKRASSSDGSGFLNFLSYMFKLSGQVEAFLKASLDVVLLGTVWSQKTDPLTLFKFSLGGGQPASSGGLIGNAIQSYIQDGTVFWDANFNGILDAGEPSTTTNLDGSYALDVPIDRWDVNGNFRLDATDGRVVVQGGTDQLSGQPLQDQLTALPNSLVVTPLTTLKADLVRGLVLQGSVESVATVVVETQLKKVLGISDAVNLDNFNPIAALLNLKDPNGAQVYQTHVQIQTLLLNTKEFLSSATGKTGGVVNNAAIDAIAKAIGSADPTKVINLADAAQLKALLANTLQATAQLLAGNTLDPTKLAKQVNSTLDVAAKGNTLNADLASSLKLAIANGNNLNSTLEGFSSNKIIAQTFLPMETKAVVEGTQGFYLKDPITDSLVLQEGKAFTFNLSDRFVNVSGDPITYTITETLPTGLTFNSTTGILQGTLPAATAPNTAPLLIGFSAANTKGTQLSGSFSLKLNYIPTAIGLTNSTVTEKVAIGTVVGELNTTDANTTDTFTYKLVTGAGSDDNAAFAIDGNKLKTAKTFDAAQQNQYKVRVLTQDASGSVFEKPLTIQIQSTNNPPRAADDNATTTINTAVNIDVLKNDQDINKDPLSLSILTLPLHGKATVNNNNTPDKKDDDFISYLPVAAYTGSDSFTYQIDDGKGGKSSAKVNITVNAVNQNELIAGAAGSNLLQLNGNNLTKLEATLINKQVKQFTIDEIGVFAVDDVQGRVNGLLPNDSGYLKAALQKAQVIFSVLPDDFLSSPNRILQGFGGQQLAFYLIQNGTTDEVLRNPNSASKVRFGSPIGGKDLGTLKLTSTTANQFTLAFDDGLGSDRNPDITLSLKLTDAEVPIGSNLQGSNEQEIVDLTQFKGQKIAAFFPTVASEAAYGNVVGFYRIENKQGSVFDPLTGKTINVGDAEYTQAAIRNSQSFGMDFNRQNARITKMLDGGSLFAPFIIANGNVNQVLNNASGNQPAVYFSYLGANPDKVDHIRLLGSNAWGFEDLAGGGDRDFNDIVIRAEFKPVA